MSERASASFLHASCVLGRSLCSSFAPPQHHEACQSTTHCIFDDRWCRVGDGLCACPSCVDCCCKRVCARARVVVTSPTISVCLRFPSAPLSACLPVCLVCLPVCLPACLPVCLPCLSVCPPIPTQVMVALLSSCLSLDPSLHRPLARHFSPLAHDFRRTAEVRCCAVHPSRPAS